MTDYRISIEELENQAEIAEMARNLIQEAMQETKRASATIIMTIQRYVILFIYANKSENKFKNYFKINLEKSFPHHIFVLSN